MDNIINKIIEIDQKAFALKEKTKEMIEKSEIRLKKSLDELEKSILEEARNKGREEYEKLIEEGEIKRKKYRLEGEAACENLEKIFLSMHEDLAEKIFYEIL